MLSKSDIKESVSDIKTEKVPTPEWGLDKPVSERFLLVRGFTAEERDNYERSLIDQKKKGAVVNLVNLRTRLVSLSVVDESGNLVFSDADIEWLCKRSAAAIDRLFSKAQELSGMSDEDVEELRKNLESIPAENSTSA